MAAPVVNSFKKEATFSAYDKAQGAVYAQARRDYHPSVYQSIIDHHKSTGGQFDTLIDIGCGPGNVARGLGKYFDHAFGLDPGEGMISAARTIGGTTSTDEPIRFEVSTAEDLGSNLSPPTPEGSVDLIASGNAAHWFDHAKFWPKAAQMLKPGGSVALWTSGEGRIHPDTPNADTIQAVFDDFREKYLRPYMEYGNLLVLSQYRDLPLPWTLDEPVLEFDKESFFVKYWETGEQFYGGVPDMDLATFEKAIATGSPVTRWRQAHPELVGTDQDVVKIASAKMARLLHEAGVKPGEELIRPALNGALLILKKKA